MGNIKTALHLMRFNWATLWRFEALFMVCGLTLTSLVSSALLKLTMRAQGIAFISADNVMGMVTNPLTWVYAIFVVLLFSFVGLFEASCLMFVFDASRQEKKADIRATFVFGWRNSIRLFKEKGKNLGVIVPAIVILPYFGMGVWGAFIGSFQMPEFIAEAIDKNMLYSVAIAIFFIALFLLVVRWCFVLHYYTLETCNSKESRKKSAAIGFKNRLVSLIVAFIILAAALFLALLVAVIALVILVVAYLSIELTNVFGAAALAIVAVLVACGLLCCFVFVVPLSTLALSTAFYRQKEKRGEEPVDIEVPAFRPLRRVKIVTWVIAAATAGFCACSLTIVIYAVATEGFDLTLGSLFSEPRIEVTAHRGGSHSAPENTMAAFNKAAENEADWCELDVQMSKDGKLIILHDANFERTCGVDANTWDLTWNEIEQLDASYGWEEYAGEKVPSLEEVIDWAKTTGMKLNIEIKPTGYEPSSLEQAVVDMINQKDFKEQCWVASLNYDVLEKVKVIDPGIHTLLNMVLAYGDISSMSAADNFSVEATSATEDQIDSVHKAGKEIAVWTVNDENNMTAMVMTDIDNIVTDEVTKAQNLIELFSGRAIGKMMKKVSNFKYGITE